MTKNIIEGKPGNFTMMPNILMEMGLSVHAIALYCAIARSAGQGTCTRSARTLARNSGMSVAMVSATKQKLCEVGLIVIQKVPSKRGQAAHHISLVPVWGINEAYFLQDVSRRPAPPLTILNGKLCSQGDTHRSPHDLIRSPRDPIRSPHDQSNNLSSKNLVSNNPPETAPPSGNGDDPLYHLIDLDEEIRDGAQVARNHVTVSCPVCQATGISQRMNKCPDCQATIIWQGSKTWTGIHGSTKKYIRRLKGISLRPKTDYERKFVKFFGRNGEFNSEEQATKVRLLQHTKPEDMLMGQIEWGVQKGRAWQQVVAAGENDANYNRHNARRDPVRDGGQWSEAELEEARARSLATEPITDIDAFFAEKKA